MSRLKTNAGAERRGARRHGVRVAQQAGTDIQARSQLLRTRAGSGTRNEHQRARSRERAAADTALHRDQPAPPTVITEVVVPKSSVTEVPAAGSAAHSVPLITKAY